MDCSFESSSPYGFEVPKATGALYLKFLQMAIALVSSSYGLFFMQAINKHGAPEKITLDGYAATHRAVGELKEPAILPINVCVRTSKYLNNMVEQDHRRVKQRVNAMLGFKRFENAAVTISGIELIHKIRKGQFDTSEIRLKEWRAEEVWQAVLAA
jgi:hypothetical protein